MTPRYHPGSSSDESGYFPPGKSILRKVHDERIVGAIYGQLSLLKQASNPLAFTGLMQSTSGLDAPFKRLARTAQKMEVVFFGSRAEADRVTAGVRRMHANVQGTIERDAGKFEAGSRFSANDSDLALWILACLADSSLAVYKNFVGPLSHQELRQFWQEYKLVGELFALAPEAMPDTYDDFRAYMRGKLDGDDLFVTDEARELGRQVAFALPLPPHFLPALPAVNLAVLGLLPQSLRQMYRLQWSPLHNAAFQSMALASRLSHPFVLPALRRGPSGDEYGQVARTEARLNHWRKLQSN